MTCPNCRREVAPGDRFCNGCGTRLPGDADPAGTGTATSGDTSGDTDDRASVDTSDGDGSVDVWEEEPVWAPTGQVAVTTADVGDVTPPSGTATGDLPVTEPMPAAPTRTDQLPVTEPTPVAGPTTDQLPATEPMPVSTPRTDELPATEPLPVGIATDELPQTEPITEVWMDPSEPDPVATPYDFTEREEVTTQVPTHAATTAMPTVVPAVQADHRHRFRFGLLLVISLVTGIVSLVALFANVLSITSDTRLVAREGTPADFRTGTWIVDDLADNLSIAGLIAIAAMVAGGVASGFRWRWGSGLAGGAGLAMAGVAALSVGLAQFPIETARAFARVPTDDPFVLTITRDLGYWLLVAAGTLGVVLFFAAVNDAFGDHRAGLNPWIAALGGLAVVVTAAGPLLPENQAVFSDNWYLIEGPGEAPALLLAVRLVQLGLFLIGGLVGFLAVSRWGLGLAIGATLPGLWLVVSTLFEITDDPVGLGYRNQGAVDMHVHGVTIIGASSVLAMLVLALVGAYDQGIRERHLR